MGAPIAAIAVGPLAAQVPQRNANLIPLRAALIQGTARVVFAGDSILENNNQNSRFSGLPYIIQRLFGEEFPEAAIEYVNLALGGRDAWHLASPAYVGLAADNSPNTGYYRQANNTLNNNGVWRTEDGTTLNGSVIGEAWLEAVKRVQPDAVFMNFGLNEDPGKNPCTDPAGYYRSMKYLIDAMAGWSKRPTIIIATSHTGLPDTAGRTDDLAGRALGLTVGRIARALAKQYKLPIIDGQRQYELLTRGVDVTNPEPHVEAGLRYNGGLNSGAAFTLDPTYWATYASDGTTASSASGATFRGDGNAAWHYFRKRNTPNGHVQVSFTPNTSNPRPEVYYRAVPGTTSLTDDKYLVRLNGANVELASYDTLTNGSSNTLRVIASAPLDVAVSNGQTYYLDIVFDGARHIIRVNGKMKIDTTDYTHMRSGWIGFGQGASGQNTAIKIGVGFQDGVYVEYFDDKVVNTSPAYTDANLLGTVNDWGTNPDSVGGNTSVHMTTAAYGLVYEPAVKDMLKRLRAAMAL